MQTAQTTQSIAYAFMILMAGLLVITNYGRDSAFAANTGTEAPAAMMPAYPAGAGPVVGPPQYGLVQTGVVGVASLDGTGRPAVMPVFQIVQLQSAAALAAGNVALEGMQHTGPGAAASAARQQTEAKIPQGINVTQPAPAGMSGTLCEIKGVRLLTETADTCAAAGGLVPTL